MDELDRSHVDATGGLCRDQEGGLGSELASDHDLLLVAARQGLDGGLRRRRADVELAHELLRQSIDRLEVAHAKARELGLVVPVEDKIVGDGVGADKAVGLAILGHMTDAHRMDVAWRLAECVLAEDRDSLCTAGAQTRECLHQFTLAVALHPRDAQDLPGAYLQ